MEPLYRLGEKLAAWVGDRTQFGVKTNVSNVPLIEEGLDYHSLNRLLNYDGYDPDTSLYYNKKSQGFILEACPMLGASEENVNILTSLVTDVLPQQVDLQFILWGSPKIGDILDQFEQARSGGGEVIAWLAKKRTDFLKQGAFKSLSQHGSFILRDIRLFIVASIEKREKEQASNTLITLRDDIAHSLKSINLPTKVIAVDEFLSVLSDILHPTSSVYPTKQRWNPYDSLSQQLVDPESLIRVHKDKLVIENGDEVWEARALSVKEYPESSAQWKMTDAIGQLFNTSLQIPSPFITTLSIRLINHEKAVFKSQMKTVNKEKTARSPLAKFMPRIAKEHSDWAFVQSRIAEGDKLVETYYQVMVFAKESEANGAERKVRDLYRANGWRLKKTLYLQFQSYLAMLPMMMSEGLYADMRLLGRFHTMTAFNAMNIAPLQGECKGTSTPSMVLPGRRGQLARWEPFDNEGNFNMAIMAAPRKGKSVFTQEYIVSILGGGGRVWVIDVGRSYQKTCKMLGGQFIEFTESTHICLNPFTFILDINESMDLLKQIFASMARPIRGATEDEIGYLEKAIYAAWEKKKNDATISTVATWLEEHDDPISKSLSHVLFNYTTGSNAKYFEGACTVNFDNAFIVIELQELSSKKDLRRIVLQMVIFLISQKMYHSGRSQKKVCIIDEAWEIFDSEDIAAGKFIEAGYRKAPKYRGSFVSIAHSVDDFLKNQMSQAAFTCSDFKIFFGQTADAINRLKNEKIIDMDGFTERLFKSLKVTTDYSECVIKSNEGMSLFCVVLDPYSRILFSTKGEEFDAIERLEKQGHTLIEAVEIVARKFNYGNS